MVAVPRRPSASSQPISSGPWAKSEVGEPRIRSGVGPARQAWLASPFDASEPFSEVRHRREGHDQQPGHQSFHAGPAGSARTLRGAAARTPFAVAARRRSADGRLKVGFLTGDRGIGKTSLARFATFVAERDHKLLGLHVILGGATCADDMVQRVFERLANVARERPLWDRIGQLFGDRIRNVGAFGLQVEFRPKPEDLDSITDSFDQALRSVIERFGEDEHRGLFIVLDDVNGLAGSSTFATWLKNFVDTVAINWDSFPVFLLFVCSERIRRELVSHNESAARIFVPFEVSNWSPDETRAFYRRAFEKVGMTVGEPACHLMADFTGGLPVLAHEIGDAAFRFANEPTIRHAATIGRRRGRRPPGRRRRRLASPRPPGGGGCGWGRRRVRGGRARP